MSQRRCQHLGGSGIEGLYDRNSWRQGVVELSVLRSLRMAELMALVAGGILVGRPLHPDDKYLPLVVNIQRVCLGCLFHVLAQIPHRRQEKILAADMQGCTDLG